MPKEGFRYGPFKTYQVPLRRIEELADVKFSKAVRDSDVFRQDEIEETVSTARYVEITSADDIILTRSRNNREVRQARARPTERFNRF